MSHIVISHKKDANHVNHIKSANDQNLFNQYPNNSYLKALYLHPDVIDWIALYYVHEIPVAVVVIIDGAIMAYVKESFRRCGIAEILLTTLSTRLDLSTCYGHKDGQSVYVKFPLTILPAIEFQQRFKPTEYRIIGDASTFAHIVYFLLKRHQSHYFTLAFYNVSGEYWLGVKADDHYFWFNHYGEIAENHSLLHMFREVLIYRLEKKPFVEVKDSLTIDCIHHLIYNESFIGIIDTV